MKLGQAFRLRTTGIGLDEAGQQCRLRHNLSYKPGVPEPRSCKAKPGVQLPYTAFLGSTWAVPIVSPEVPSESQRTQGSIARWCPAARPGLLQMIGPRFPEEERRSQTRFAIGSIGCYRCSQMIMPRARICNVSSSGVVRLKALSEAESMLYHLLLFFCINSAKANHGVNKTIPRYSLSSASSGRKPQRHRSFATQHKLYTMADLKRILNDEVSEFDGPRPRWDVPQDNFMLVSYSYIAG